MNGGNENVLCMSTPMNNRLIVSFGCPNCKIIIGGQEESIDLAMLAMFDFDVIIGMDWLVRQKTIVDCSDRTIQFNPNGRPSFVF